MTLQALAVQSAWRHRRKLIAFVVVCFVGGWLMLLLVIAAITSAGGQEQVASSGLSCTGAGGGTAELTSEQAPYAAVIVRVGQRLKVPPKGLVVAIATALQESGLRNLAYGDRDSVGLFQQRPISGWGSVAQIMNPELSALAFYGGATHTANPGLLDIAGWESMPITVAAQAVQRSAFPDAYAKHVARSVAIVEAVTGGSGLCSAVTAGQGDGPWRLPMAAGSYTNTSPFGMRRHPVTGEMKLHAGADLAAPTGTPVTALSAGTVTFAGTLGTYGNVVMIDHGGGLSTRYPHLSSISVTKGQRVPVGALVGAVGATGRVTGPHLHLEVRLNNTAVDPVAWLRTKGVDLLGGKVAG